MSFSSFVVFAFVLLLPLANARSYLDEYCEAPKPIFFPPTVSGAELTQVIVVSRHGDRSPLSVFPDEYKDTRITWNCTLQVPMRAFIDDGTKTTPTGTYFIYSEPRSSFWGNARGWNGNCFPGQLTEKGGEMCKRLGSALRDIYVKQYPLLPESLQPGDEGLVHLRVTDFARTKESLLSILEGLFPSETRKGVFLPVYVFETPYGTMHPNSQACPRLVQLEQKTFSSEKFVEDFKKVKPVMDEVNRIAGTVNSSGWDSHHDSDSWFDVLAARTCHNIPYPCSGGKCVTKDMAETIAQRSNFQASWLYFDDETGKITGGPVIQNIIHSFTDKITGVSKAKYVHLSAHDSTIDTVLGALKYNGGFPPYASSVRFEFWNVNPKKVVSDESAYAVRIIYNNQIVIPPECQNQEMCPYTVFLKMVQTRLTIKDMKKECSAK